MSTTIKTVFSSLPVGNATGLQLTSCQRFNIRLEESPTTTSTWYPSIFNGKFQGALLVTKRPEKSFKFYKESSNFNMRDLFLGLDQADVTKPLVFVQSVTEAVKLSEKYSNVNFVGCFVGMSTFKIPTKFRKKFKKVFLLILDEDKDIYEANKASSYSYVKKIFEKDLITL